MKYSDKTVSFSERKHIFYYDCDKTYCYRKDRSKKKTMNRKLRTVERYMKQNDLLHKDEMLEFTKDQQKHIRGDFINYIAKKRKMIRKKEYVKIIT